MYTASIDLQSEDLIITLEGYTSEHRSTLENLGFQATPIEQKVPQWVLKIPIPNDSFQRFLVQTEATLELQLGIKLTRSRALMYRLLQEARQVGE